MPLSRQGHKNLFKPHLSELLPQDVFFLTFLLLLSEKKRINVLVIFINPTFCKAAGFISRVHLGKSP